MKKLINFNGLEKEIQDYANKNHNGNFNEAVRSLVEKSLNK
tara:strand:+ start:756 stop:878 length:123 start_codon:yes stop_codon:yes gene_type:complete